MSELSFGVWLKRRRAGLGLTQAELADALGYSFETIRKLEVDKLRPSKQLAAKLAQALELPPEQHAAFIHFARDEGPLPDLPTQTTVLPPTSPITHASLPHNLPTPPTPLVGRETELAVLLSLLQRPDLRLVTLTGPGGSGKTRLALELAHHLLTDDQPSLAQHSPLGTQHFPDGVYFLNLAPITDPALVTSTIAQTLDVREASGRPLLDVLKNSLRDKQMLLLLDNVEQVVEAAPIVADLLAHAPHLKVLATSRVPLHLRGEKEFLVSPLPLPERHSTGDYEIRTTDYGLRITQYGSVALFIQRAQDVKPDFQVTNDNAPAVAEICHRLDGLPLAIELAAARIKALTPLALLGRLEHRLPVLTGGARDLPARQQTLRNTIAWSYDLLDEGEKTLFRRLAVFVGGCTLGAAEAVYNVGEDWQLNVLDGLISLVDKSLLKQEEQLDGEPRYVMLETIREFALERLEEGGDAEFVRQNHMRYFLVLSETAVPHLRGPSQLAWYRRLETEHDNLRAALDWSKTSSSPDTWLRFVVAVSDFWHRRHYYDEARHWLDQAVQQAHAVAPLLRSQVLAALGPIAQRQGDRPTAMSCLQASIASWPPSADAVGLTLAMCRLGNFLLDEVHHATARSLAQEALTIARSISDGWILAWPLRLLGHLAVYDSDYARAEALYSEAYTLLQAAGDKQYQGAVLDNLTELASRRGDNIKGAQLAERHLAVSRAQDDKRGISRALNGLGELARLAGDYERARQFYSESLAISRQMRHRAMIPSLQLNLGYVALHQGEYAQAEALFRASLVFSVEKQTPGRTLNCIAGLAGVAGALGQLQRASRLFGAVATHSERLQYRLDPADQIEFDRNVAAVRAQLTDDAFNAAWAEGRAMTLEQAIAFALSLPEPVFSPTDSADAPPF